MAHPCPERRDDKKKKGPCEDKNVTPNDIVPLKSAFQLATSSEVTFSVTSSISSKPALTGLFVVTPLSLAEPLALSVLKAPRLGVLEPETRSSSDCFGLFRALQCGQ